MGELLVIVAAVIGITILHGASDTLTQTEAVSLGGCVVLLVTGAVIHLRAGK